MKTTHVRAKRGDTVLLIGTAKGAFIATSNGQRKKWTVGGPHFPGHPIGALAYDSRKGRNRIWLAGENPFFGANIHSSDDFGKKWTKPKQSLIKFPEATGKSLTRVWQIQPGIDGELYAGVEPAALFVSRDDGKSFSLVEGLFNHPTREKWQPGGGGLCLHTILPDPEDPKRLLIAVSTAGVYVTEDGGKSWRPSNKGVRAEFMPNKHPEFGQCVHKVVRDATEPKRLFLQNHWGLYRSDDGGQSWKDIARGVPSDFGFAMARHPHKPNVAYCVPLEADMFRVTPEGKLRVFKTTDGKQWKPLTKGLPQKDALETVLRDAMCTDDYEKAGVYFGTRSGKVYASNDEGGSWSLLRDGLPPVLCVRAARVAA